MSEEIRKLEPLLVPHHVTGIDAPFSGEQSLGERVGVLDTERNELRAQLEDARHENSRLREVLFSRMEQQNEQLRSELDELKTENERLAESQAVTRVD